MLALRQSNQSRRRTIEYQRHTVTLTTSLDCGTCKSDFYPCFDRFDTFVYCNLPIDTTMPLQCALRNYPRANTRIVAVYRSLG